jgi:hypothetical protein
MKSLPLSAIALLLLLSAPVFALPLKQYQAARKEDSMESIVNYINGIGNGYLWANSALAAESKEPLFCNPELTLNEDNYLALLDRQIKDGTPTKTKWRDDDPIEIILLRALQRTFPCRK